jgi:RNA polymerase sigma-70 factor (ECF subfamily)
MQVITTILTAPTMQATETKTLTDEEKLILAAKANRDRFQPLYEKYYAQILKFVYQRVTTKDDAYDITQQVFLQAMLSLDKYELRGFPFSSWLYRIAINELNQAFRKNEKQRGINLEEHHLKDIAQEMNETSADEKENILLEALTGLEEDDFQLVEMRFFEKRAFKEIGEILNITEANAKMKLYRILDKLKPILEKKIAY